MAKCYVVNRADGTGPCQKEATQLNAIDKPVCDDCAEFSAWFVKEFNIQSRRVGHGFVYNEKPLISNN